jgi:AbrB family looped-hinge helix DNA binding protein
VKQITSTVTSKGQVTIPAEVRKHLGIDRGDKISFLIEEEGVIRIVAPRYSNVASLRGAAGTLEKPSSWKEIVEVAHDDRARELRDHE